jgi:hypothetical protein
MEINSITRVYFRKLSGNKMIVETRYKLEFTVICTEEQMQELDLIASVLQEGNVFNLLNVKELKDRSINAEFIVFEPDYMIDISTLSECFRFFGNHELNYILSRLHERETTPPILLGNTANYFLDELLGEDAEHPLDYRSVMKKMFATAAFDFTACDGLNEPRIEERFFADAVHHFNNIRHTIREFFPKAGINREKATLEPSFICSTLGLQGRLDLMADDFSYFIELKSGKAVEDFRNNGQFIRSAESHYTQMILYLATLEFNLSINPDQVRSYLLYSKYPVLCLENHSRKQLGEALKLRNRIVGQEYALQKANNTMITKMFLSEINSINLNKAGIKNTLFTQYIAPSIDSFQTAFAGLSETEKTYFLRVYTFIVKELWLSKCGCREYEGVKHASCLWNAPFNEKLAAGELLYNLKITGTFAADGKQTVQLAIPEYPGLYLPNFRQGDAVVLYEFNTESDSVNNRQVLRGTIETLETCSMTFHLRYKQKNPNVLKQESRYAIEHDYMDPVFTGMFRSLAAFLNANSDRKKLIIEPHTAGTVNGEREISIIAGPPGTGKTSIALKRIVESELEKPGTNILLIAYTNRAVDEICRALSSIDNGNLEYMRIGSELSCAPEFRSHLIDNCLAECNNRKEVSEIADRYRVVTGTASTIWNKQELFRVKHFSLAIIDEATQLLEPHLLGIFCVKDKKKRNAVDRFVLIGDHRQLPAIVMQSREESAVSEPELNESGLVNLGDSLFERFYRQFKKHSITESFSMLTKQGRMHPDIAAFPSEQFYEGLLESAGLPHQRVDWPQPRIQFFNIRPSKEDLSDKANSAEAFMVKEICLSVYNNCLASGAEFDPSSVGIITPYRSQIALIRSMLHETGIKCFDKIMVDTVERFQGSQRDTIIYSFCIKTKSQLDVLPNRPEENGKIIDRKLNVALTRARKQLFITGNRRLLHRNEIYRKLIEYIETLK